jgi:hypothetical protein
MIHRYLAIRNRKANATATTFLTTIPKFTGNSTGRHGFGEETQRNAQYRLE